MNYTEAAALGFLQGATEFLPVSSSGHLRILEDFFGMREPETFFDIVLHIGSLVAVLFFFRREISLIFLSLSGKKGGESAVNGRALFFAIMIASISTAVIGYLFGDYFEKNLSSIPIVGLFLIINGFILLSTKLRRCLPGDERVSLLKAAAIGVVQGVALLRGLSRSGATIATAVHLGIKPESAMSFSFLISIPATAGALVLKLPEAGGSGIPIGVYLTGAVVSAITSFLALKILKKVMVKMVLYWFAPYSFAVGAFALIVWGAQ